MINLPLSQSQVEFNETKGSAVFRLANTSSTPCRQSCQLIEPCSTISLKLFRSRAVNNLPLSQSQVELNGTKKSTVPSLALASSSTPCRRSRQLIELCFTVSSQLFRSRAAKPRTSCC